MADDPIVKAPDMPGQPYDAAADGAVAGWDKPADSFPDGPGPWVQT
jgi:hypothetical protein